jgi:hypothetical protein
MASEKTITIIINRVEYLYKKDKICYKDVLKTIGEKDNNSPKQPVFTIVVDGEKLLKGGDCIQAYDSMEITVGNTTKA